MTDSTNIILYKKYKLDEAPYKLLDVSKLLATGWKPEVGLEERIKTVYKSVFI